MSESVFRIYPCGPGPTRHPILRHNTSRSTRRRRTLGLRGEKENRCSFCGKGQDDVRIIAGPNVWICDECVQLCCDVFWPDEALPWSAPGSHA